MKKLFLTGIAALLLATPAQADCCDMPKTVRAGPAFQAAAKQQFGRGTSYVGIYDKKTVAEEAKRLPPGVAESLSYSAVLVIKDARYLGVDKDYKDGSYLLCNYRTKPVIRFFKCNAWEGE
jgi:hypothetical protein